MAPEVSHSELCVTSTASCPNTSSTPFWKLAFILDSILLYPIAPTEPPSVSDALHHRFRLFSSGQLEVLHSLSRLQRDRTVIPQHTTSPNHPGAQRAADAGNYRAAFQKLPPLKPLLRSHWHDGKSSRASTLLTSRSKTPPLTTTTPETDPNLTHPFPPQSKTSVQHSPKLPLALPMARSWTVTTC